MEDRFAAPTSPDEDASARRLAPAVPKEGFFVRHPRQIELTARVIFGLAVLAAGASHLLPGDVPSYVAQVTGGTGPWFAFWRWVIRAHPYEFTYGLTIAELTLGASILFGVLRKIIYAIGIALGLFLWTVTEGLSGLSSIHGLAASAGLLYVVGLLLLITIEITYGPDELTIDATISPKHPGWARLANFRGRTEPLQPPRYMLAFAPTLVSPTEDSEAGRRVRSRGHG
jgi:uncharacterized membrane protein YphA (DoxX/SURF4 family)